VKIVVISSSVFPSPPKNYGGLELVTYLLAKGLSELNIETYLVAPKGSLSDGYDLIETIEPQMTVNANWFEREEKSYRIYRPIIEKIIDDETVIIDHSWFKHMYLWKKEKPDLKVIGVIHGMVSWRTPPPVEHPCLVGVSREHAFHISWRLGVHAEYVWNGIDASMYPVHLEKMDYYLSLNRIMREKGIHEFTYIMKATGKRGIIIGEDKFVSDKNYVTKIKNECSKIANLEYIGTVSNDDKIRYLKHAKALLALPLYPYLEVFGLYTVEAMASGTPVIALKNGGLKDIVKDEETGFLCNDIKEVIEIVKQDKAEEINPIKCRERVEKLFTYNEMAKRYIELCRKVINGNGW